MPGFSYYYTDEEVRTVWRKSAGRCIYGQRIRVNLGDHGITWEIDHANPYGTDDLRNWNVSCYRHNHQKSNRTRQEYERLIHQGYADYE